MYRFGHQQLVNVVDPSSQTEDLGDDAIKASDYGIKNLKIILPKLQEWTNEKGQNYTELKTMHEQVFSQFNRYMGHVGSNIGGVYEHFKTSDQEGAVYTHVDENHQRNALKFLNKHLFTTPTWMIDKDISSKTQFSGHADRVMEIQSTTLSKVLKKGRLTRMIENQTLNGSKAYTILTMMGDLRRGIWSELYSKKPIDIYRRNLQRAHIDQLDSLMNAKNQHAANTGSFKATGFNASLSDVKPIVRGELNRIKRDAKKAIATAPNRITRYHLQDIVERINVILDQSKLFKD
jgi:hypothetical protein